MATTSKTAIPLTEKQFMAMVIELAKLCDWRHFHVHDARRSPSGWPDLALLRPPDLLFVETKTDRGRLTPAQRTWLEALARCPNVEVYTWRPGDWPAIVERLKMR